MLGRTDEEGGRILDPGWRAKRPIYIEDIAITLYSAMGIDWTRQHHNTPSGRAFYYVEPFSGTTYVPFQEVAELFG